MALYNFFKKIGTINYNDQIVNNLLVSVRFKEIVESKAAVFYPYTVKDGDRPDTIAAFYYDDDRYDWVVYLSNYVFDPYFEWPLGADNFNNFIISKYGSKETALSDIKFYRNAWYDDDSILSTSAYNALSTGRKKYWNPDIGYNNNIVSYSRKKIDLYTDTNKIINVGVNSITSMAIGDLVFQQTSGTITGQGKIDYIGNNYLTLKNIQGEFLTTGGSVGALINRTTNSSKSISTVTTVSVSIPADEFVYWEPVTSYEYESELNEGRKNIILLDKQFIDVLEEQMDDLLR